MMCPVHAHIDVSKSLLEVGKSNFVSNRIPLHGHEFIAVDTMKYLVYAEANRVQYDIVVCDPPTVFNDANKTTISCNKHYDELVEKVASVVKPGGYMVLFCNSKSLRIQKWLSMIEKGIFRYQKKCLRTSEVPHTYLEYHQPDDKEENPLSLFPSISESVGESDQVKGRNLAFKFVKYLFAAKDFREWSDDPSLKGVILRRLV